MSDIHLFIDNRSGKAIYEQIYTQIRSLVLEGKLAPDEPLPSIRALARDLRISVITTKRAYDELEKEGILYTVAGKGSFAARQNREMLREQNLVKIEDHLNEIRTLAAQCALTRGDLHTMLDLLWEDEER